MENLPLILLCVVSEEEDFLTHPVAMPVRFEALSSFRVEFILQDAENAFMNLRDLADGTPNVTNFALPAASLLSEFVAEKPQVFVSVAARGFVVTVDDVGHAGCGDDDDDEEHCGEVKFFHNCK